MLEVGSGIFTTAGRKDIAAMPSNMLVGVLNKSIEYGQMSESQRYSAAKKDLLGLSEDIGGGMILGIGIGKFSGIGVNPNVLDPKKVHFMQNSISNKTGNYTVVGNARGLSNGTINPKVLTIRVWKDATGKIWTLDHRRLAAFRLAGSKSVPVEWASPSEINMKKMRTSNGGTSIKVRGIGITID